MFFKRIRGSVIIRKMIVVYRQVIKKKKLVNFYLITFRTISFSRKMFLFCLQFMIQLIYLDYFGLDEHTRNYS